MQRYIDTLEAKLEKAKEKKVEKDIKDTKWSWEEPRRISMDGSKPQKRFSLAGCKRRGRKSHSEPDSSDTSSGDETQVVEHKKRAATIQYCASSGDSSTSEEEFMG